MRSSRMEGQSKTVSHFLLGAENHYKVEKHTCETVQPFELTTVSYGSEVDGMWCDIGGGGGGRGGGGGGGRNDGGGGEEDRTS